MKHARFVLLIVLAVCLVLTADLLYNYLNAMTSVHLNEAAECTGLFSQLVFGGEWSLRHFSNGVLIAMGSTLAVAVANIVLACVDLYRKK